MRTRSLSFALLLACAVAAVAGTAVAVLAAAVDPAFLESEQKWREARLKSLTRESGWLTLVGLHWLAPGPNRMGAAKDAPVRLDAPGIPADAGTLVLNADAGRVVLQPAAGVPFTIEGKPVGGPRELAADVTGKPDVVKLGRLSFFVIKRDDRFGIRVKDPESPTRTQFKGLDYFPPDPAWRVEATYEPLDTPRDVSVPTAIGTTEPAKAYGVLKFTVGGRQMTMLPLQDGPTGDISLVFADKTSGEETYGAGRFLDTGAPKDGKVVLDFNQAYNPPCAFTPFATCPLPLRENKLPIRVPAGEKKYAGGH